MKTEIRYLKKIKLRDPVLLVGLPGIGLVGKICIDYLTKQLKVEKVAKIYSDSFPSSVMTKDGILDLIYDELYLFKAKERDFLFLGGLVQPLILDPRFSRSDEHYEFAGTLVKEFKRLGVKEIVTLAGVDIGEERLEHEPKIVVASTDKKILRGFTSAGCEESRNGLITGAAGMLVGLGADEGIKGACLMGQTSARLVIGDHAAAKKVLELLIKRYGFKVDVAQIEKEAKEVEKGFSQLQEEIAKQKEEQEDKDSGRPLPYIR